nr:LysM peptidoglycan-binding domain-containing protein [Flavobacterium covae]
MSKKYNTTVAELRKKNNIKENDLQPGMKIKI